MANKPRTKPKSGARKVTRHNGNPPSWTQLPSWLALTVALCANLISVGYAYADLRAGINQHSSEITRIERQTSERMDRIERSMIERVSRNEQDDKDRASATAENIRQLNLAIANMGQLKTDVEVMKTSLTAIVETLRRLERKWDPISVAPKIRQSDDPR